jgi:hypothetical protein
MGESESLMNLDKICSEYWKKKDGSDPDDSVDFHSLIQRYQTDNLLPVDAQNLLHRVICKNGKIRKVWADAKRFIYNHIFLFYKNADKEIAESSRRQLTECCGAVLNQGVERCLKAFDIKRVETCDNQNILTLLSGFIAQSIYYHQVIRDIGLGYFRHEMEICLSELIPEGREDEDIEAETFVSDSLSSEQKIILEDFFEKIIQYIKANATLINVGAFVSECITGQSHKSDKARQQKTRLKKHLKSRYTELDDATADYIIEKIEILLFEKKLQIF